MFNISNKLAILLKYYKFNKISKKKIQKYSNLKN